VNVGERVYWRHESRRGYGYVNQVAALVEAIHGEKASVRAALKTPEGWKRVTRVVPLEKRSPRTAHLAAVDD
jgi:hypothetical protein